MTESGTTLKERYEDPEDGFEVRTPSRCSISFEPSSIDLHLGKYIGKVDQEKLVKVWDEDTYPEWDIIHDEFPIVQPGEFMLAHTEEDITIPPDSVGFLHGRSSVGRLGLFIHNSGLIDPNFSGDVTLELINPAPYPIELAPGMRICQMTVQKLDSVPDTKYSEENGNKYQGQRKPTPSRLYRDFE